MTGTRKETDSLGVVEVPSDKLWGAQTQRSLEHFSIGKDLIPREMITAYATLKKAAALANHNGKRLDDQRYKLIVQVCDEILANQHHERGATNVLTRDIRTLSPAPDGANAFAKASRRPTPGTGTSGSKSRDIGLDRNAH